MSGAPGTLPVAAAWFAAAPAGPGVTLLTEPFVHEFLRANIWFVAGRESDLLVDTGNGIGALSPAVRDLREDPAKPLLAVVTHAHADHMGGLHEFPDRAVHRLEAEALETGADEACLLTSQFPTELRQEVADEGLLLPDVLVTAAPHEGFDPRGFAAVPVAPTRLLGEGDALDLGDRAFTVLHLPGHSPGSIGLWDEQGGVLFSGDAVFSEGPLLDQLPESDVAAYLRTMERLRDLPVTTVHGGHEASFDRARLREIADDYLARRGRRRATKHRNGGTS